MEDASTPPPTNTTHSQVFIKPHNVSMSEMVANNDGDGPASSVIHVWGLDANEKPVVLTVVGFTSWCYVELPPRSDGRLWSPAMAQTITSEIIKRHAPECLGGVLCSRSKLYFYQPQRNAFQMLKLWFASVEAMNNFSSRVERAAAIPAAADCINAAYKSLPPGSSLRDIVDKVCGGSNAEPPHWLKPRGLFCGPGIGHLVIRVWEGDRATITAARRFFTAIDSTFAGWLAVVGEHEYIAPNTPDAFFTIPEVRVVAPPPSFGGVFGNEALLDRCAFARERLRRATSEETAALRFPRPLVLSFDIEANSHNEFAMPVDTDTRDSAFMISVVVARAMRRDDDPPPRRLLLALERCDLGAADVPGVELRVVANEYDLVVAFADLVGEVDPDVITGYNIDGFDWFFLTERRRLFAKKGDDDARNGVWPASITRALDAKPRLKDPPRIAPSQQQTFVTHTLEVVGRIVIDMLRVMRRDYRFVKYSLDFVSRELLGETKHDVSPRDIFKAYATTLAASSLPVDDKTRVAARAEMARIGRYAVQDSELVIRLMDKTDTWLGLVGLSEVAGVTVRDVFTQGQQCRTVSLLYDLASRQGIVLDRRRAPRPYEDRDEDADGLVEVKGAYVADSKVGVHKAVSMVDYASMYPSIIILDNICPTTLVVHTSKLEGSPKAFSGRTAAYDTVAAESLSCQRLLAPSPDAVRARNRIPVAHRYAPDAAKVKDARFAAPLDSDTLVVSFSYSSTAASASSSTAVVAERTHDGGDGGGGGSSDDDDAAAAAAAKRASSAHNADGGGEVPPLADGDYCFRFVKPSVRLGLFPQLVKMLLDSRAAVRRNMDDVKARISSASGGLSPTEVAELELKLRILDKNQNALKVMANSVYGSLTAQEVGKVALVEGGMCITAMGQKCIRAVNDYVTQKLGGELILGDTDSCGFTLPGDDTRDPSEFQKRGERIAADITAHIAMPPMQLAFEKCMWMIVLCRKRYVARVYNRDGSLSSKLLLRGVVLVRRETAKHMTECYESMVWATLRDPPASPTDLFRMALGVARGALSAVVGNDTDDLVRRFEIVRGIGSGYKQANYSLAVFVRECERRGRPVHAGDRVGYVITYPPPNVAEICAESHDASVKPANLGLRMVPVDLWRDLRLAGRADEARRLDAMYYIMNLFALPIDQLFEASTRGRGEEWIREMRFSPRAGLSYAADRPLRMLGAIVSSINARRAKARASAASKTTTASSTSSSAETTTPTEPLSAVEIMQICDWLVYQFEIAAATALSAPPPPPTASE